MALQEDKHIKRIVEDKSILSGAGPDRLKKSQIAIQRDGADRRLSFRDENNNYYETANRGEVFGPTGEQGATGLPGPTGAQGVTGFGVQGATGPSGSIGVTGLPGYTGLQGSTGLRGPTGFQGFTGSQGNTGMGIPGPTGFQGPTGSQGVTGIRGATGPLGVTGLGGAPGPTGAPGGAGAPGATGAQGAEGVANFTRGSTFPVTPDDRELFWDNEDEILYFYDGATAMAWIDISSGAIGATGMQGVPGAPGVDGNVTGILNIVMSGGGDVLATGPAASVTLPYGLKFTRCDTYALETGALRCSVRAGTFDSYPPIYLMATGIGFSGAIKSSDSTLSSWAGTTGGYGDILRLTIDEASSVTQATVSLRYYKTL